VFFQEMLAGSFLAAISILAGVFVSGESITWSRGPDLPVPRGGYYAAWYDQGLLIAGGNYWANGKKLWTDKVHFFDPASGTWRERKPLPRRLAYGSMTASSAGVFLLGGSDENQIYRDVYQLKGEEWIRVGELPAPVVFSSAVSVGVRIYLIGGGFSVTDLVSATNAVWALDTINGDWHKVDAVPGPPRTMHTSTVFKGQVYVFGGATQERGKDLMNLGDAYRLDPDSGRWKALKSAPAPVRAWCAVPSGSSIYLVGGYSDRFLQDVYRYNPALDNYEKVSSLPLPLCDSNFFFWNGHFYGAGGEDNMRSRFSGTLIGRLKG
jgi:N-acetylneuraminic acid mutarotase